MDQERKNQRTNAAMAWANTTPGISRYFRWLSRNNKQVPMRTSVAKAAITTKSALSKRLRGKGERIPGLAYRRLSRVAIATSNGWPSKNMAQPSKSSFRALFLIHMHTVCGEGRGGTRSTRFRAEHQHAPESQHGERSREQSTQRRAGIRDSKSRTAWGRPSPRKSPGRHATVPSSPT